MPLRISHCAHLLLLTALALSAWFPTCAQTDPCKPQFLHQFSDTARKTKPATTAEPAKTPQKRKTLHYDLRLNFGANAASRSPTQTGYCKLSSSLNTQLLWKFPHKRTATELECRDEISGAFIPDSLLEKGLDQLRIKIQHSHKTNDSIRLQGSSSVMLTTAKFNGKTGYAKASPGTLNSGFLSPGEVLGSAGFKWQSPGWGHLELGVAAMKITWVANKELYTIQNTDVLHQVRADQKARVDGGLSLQTQIDKRFGKHLRWESRMLIFAGIGENPARDIELRNELSLKPNNQVLTSLRSVYSYKTGRWPPGNLIGEFSIGMNLNRP